MRATTRPNHRTLALAVALTLPACDFAPSIDIDTPGHAPMAVLRSVLAAGLEPTVRVSTSRDPFAVQPANRPPSPTPVDAHVTLERHGEPAHEMVIRPQTCYLQRSAMCNAGTGFNEISEQGPFECGAFVTERPIEAGATYTLRAQIPGMPPAEATVTVPHAAHVDAIEEASGSSESRRLRIRLHDLPAAGTRYALTVRREFDAFTTTVCAVGGPRDTTIALGAPAAYETRFGTTDPVLLAGAREPADALRFVTFTDQTFEGGTHEFTVDVPTVDAGSTVTPTGRLIVQVAVLSDVLFDAYQISYFSLGDYNPFAEPINLPTNVVGGLGRVGAVAVTEVTLSGPW